MNLVLISRTSENAEGDTTQESVFCGSQDAATKVRVSWVNDGTKRKDITTVAIDVPTDKAGLLATLNAIAKAESVPAALAALRLRGE